MVAIQPAWVTKNMQFQHVTDMHGSKDVFVVLLLQLKNDTIIELTF